MILVRAGDRFTCRAFGFFMMNSPAKHIDHTLLKADASAAEIAQLCEEAVEYGFASVCVAPCHVAQAVQLLYGSDVAVCAVIGFPLGSQTAEVKVFEAQQVVASGAEEVDMVINLGMAREGNYQRVGDEIRKVVAAVDSSVVKVIIECCLFAEDAKRLLAETVAASGAGFVKTSTGFSSSGATLDDVRLLSEVAGDRVLVKASGGIRDWATCQAMLAAGAERIGTSAGVLIMQQWQQSEGLQC